MSNRIGIKIRQDLDDFLGTYLSLIEHVCMQHMSLCDHWFSVWIDVRIPFCWVDFYSTVLWTRTYLCSAPEDPRIGKLKRLKSEEVEMSKQSNLKTQLLPDSEFHLMEKFSPMRVRLRMKPVYRCCTVENLYNSRLHSYSCPYILRRVVSLSLP